MKCFDARPPPMCSIFIFKHTFSNPNLKETRQKNAHMMPNNGSKTTYFLIRLSTWFDELFKNMLSGKDYILHVTNNMSMMSYWMSHHNVHHQNISDKKKE